MVTSYAQKAPMDGSAVDHSDSDSGESWTLLDTTQAYGEDAPDFPENPVASSERENADIHSEKDEDTDGISIISDSDPELTPCDAGYDKCSSEESRPAEQETSPLLASQPPPNINNNNESIREEADFLGDKVKYRTYVHRRNPKVSTILDIIMLGTFVITAGMALGHLWSCKNECTTQTSVNKILSNLYKLQEENAQLRNKLKEITQVTSMQLVQQRKTVNDKLATKQYRCKKIFEEPIIKNNKMGISVKCVDNNKPDIILNSGVEELPQHEKEILSDIAKMKNIYNENKVWLNSELKKSYEEMAKFNEDNNNAKANDNNHSEVNIELNNLDKQIEVEQHLEPTISPKTEEFHPEIKETDSTESSFAMVSQNESNLESQIGPQPETIEPNFVEVIPEKKITYADSLKVDQPSQKIKSNNKDNIPNRRIKDKVKRKHKDNDILLNINSFSEDDIKKDDRYTGPKTKHERKKHDRQKSHKKDKRNNKYEQWEMKGGYLRDYDEFSITSSQDNDALVNKPDKKFLNPDFENYINKIADTENNASNGDQPKLSKKLYRKKIEKRSIKNDSGKKDKELEWYDKRSALRAEARMKLEHELFGENSPNNAAWYFRRMHKREQCRAQKDNSTFKKFSKRKMNFKMKR